jgi:hypothetical protein
VGLFDRFRARSGPDVFAREVVAALRAAGAARARYHRDRFAIEYLAEGRREGAWIYLANVYAECVRDPEYRRARIEQFVAAFLQVEHVPVDWSQARGMLRPVLRGATFARGPAAAVPLRRPALPYLDELVVVDKPRSMEYVTDHTCQTWGVAAEAVFAAARANLAERAELPDAELPEGPVMIRFIDDGDAYWVSHLLLDGWLAALGERVGGRPVAFAPDPASLIVVDDDPDRLASVYELAADEFGDSPRPLSPVGYTVEASGGLVPYRPPAEHALRRVVERAERVLARYEYGGQRAALTEDGVTEPVADYELYRRADGSAFSVTAWAPGALLPRADYVAFPGEGRQRFFVPWRVVAEADVFAEAFEYRPARYRAGPAPTPAAVGYLRERAVRP